MTRTPLSLPLALVGLLVVVLVTIASTSWVGLTTLRPALDHIDAEIARANDKLEAIRHKVARPAVRAAGAGDILRIPKVGYVMITDPEDMIQKELIEQGSWEPRVMELIEKHVQPGSTVVDVGAYLGCHSLALSRRVGPEGKVVAFEPSRSAANQMRRNLRLNDVENVTLIEKALGNEKGTGEMRILDPKNLGGSRVCAGEGGWACEGVAVAQPFEIVRFDDLDIE